jgi:hypothetical protein
MKIKPLEWIEYTNTSIGQLTWHAGFIEIGVEYDLGFEIKQKHIKFGLLLQNYNIHSDYHPLGNYDTLEDAKNAAYDYATREIREIMERFVE